MRSIKPGRGPSMMGGVGSIILAIFGVFWTIQVSNIGAPPMMSFFGICFVGIGIAQAVYHFKNATGQNRFSIYDITNGDEEQDPLDGLFHPSMQNRQTHDTHGDYCPYCGGEVSNGYAYCRHCGKKLPE